MKVGRMASAANRGVAERRIGLCGWLLLPSRGERVLAFLSSALTCRIGQQKEYIGFGLSAWLVSSWSAAEANRKAENKKQLTACIRPKGK